MARNKKLRVFCREINTELKSERILKIDQDLAMAKLWAKSEYFFESQCTSMFRFKQIINNSTNISI